MASLTPFNVATSKLEFNNTFLIAIFDIVLSVNAHTYQVYILLLPRISIFVNNTLFTNIVSISYTCNFIFTFPVKK